MQPSVLRAVHGTSSVCHILTPNSPFKADREQGPQTRWWHEVGIKMQDKRMIEADPVDPLCGAGDKNKMAVPSKGKVGIQDGG